MYQSLVENQTQLIERVSRRTSHGNTPRIDAKSRHPIILPMCNAGNGYFVEVAVTCSPTVAEGFNTYAAEERKLTFVKQLIIIGKTTLFFLKLPP
jgi:hypothetical protein